MRTAEVLGSIPSGPIMIKFKSNIQFQAGISRFVRKSKMFKKVVKEETGLNIFYIEFILIPIELYVKKRIKEYFKNTQNE